MTARERSYVFECHSESVLRRLTENLEIFRYVRAYGGHANDADQLLACFPYVSETDMSDKLISFGIHLTRYQHMPEQPVSGVSYRGDEFQRFPSLIQDTKWLKQPGWQVIESQKLFIWCDGAAITISLNEDYIVSVEDFVRAAQLESFFRRLRIPYLDPPVDSWHCVCPKYYPEIFPKSRANDVIP